MLRRHLVLMGKEEVERLTIKDLFRDAADAGLIADPLSGFEYQKTRNITSHNYDENKAQAAYEMGKRFVVDARKLLDELLHRHA